MKQLLVIFSFFLLSSPSFAFSIIENDERDERNNIQSQYDILIEGINSNELYLRENQNSPMQYFNDKIVPFYNRSENKEQAKKMTRKVTAHLVSTVNDFTYEIDKEKEQVLQTICKLADTCIFRWNYDFATKFFNSDDITKMNKYYSETEGEEINVLDRYKPQN